MGDKDLQKERSVSEVVDDMEFIEIPDKSKHSEDKVQKRMRICSIVLIILICIFLLVLFCMEFEVYTEIGIILP